MEIQINTLKAKEKETIQLKFDLDRKSVGGKTKNQINLDFASST
jgi:hypothetical protein